MRPRNILIGVVVLAVLLLCGAWLIPERVPVTQDARTQKCVEDQRRVLTFALVAGDANLEELEADMLAYCDCFAKEIGQRLASEELALIDRQQSTPAIDSKLAEIVKACSPETP